MSVAPVLFMSASDERFTPPAILERAASVTPLGFDPCWHPLCHVRAPRTIALPVDGLSVEWQREWGLGWVNPPFSQIGKWAPRCALFGRSGGELCMLTPARTDTAWWHASVPSASSVVFIAGRLRFDTASTVERPTSQLSLLDEREPVPELVTAEGGAPFPTAISYWGKRPARFRDAFADLGWVPYPAPPRRGGPRFAR